MKKNEVRAKIFDKIDWLIENNDDLILEGLSSTKEKSVGAKTIDQVHLYLAKLANSAERQLIEQKNSEHVMDQA